MFLRSLALSCLILASGCTRVGRIVDNGQTHHPWTHPDTLRIAMLGSPNTLNPILSTQQFEAQAEALALDPLISRDGHGRDVPILAARVPTTANGDVSRDGLRIRYLLRRGVVWQDGAPFTSRDVAFTWQAIMNPRTAVASRHGYDDVLRVETPDPFTAVFVLRHPFAPAVDTFFAPSDTPLAILPAHLLERYSSLDRIPYDALPVGTGPYRVVRWIRNDRIEYERNDRYFLGRPKIGRIVLHIIPDENTIVEQMRAHELDWFVEATPRVYPQIRGLSNVAIRLVPLNANESIQFNVTKPPWSDTRLRRAVGFAIQKSALAEKVTFGSTVPATEDLPPISWAFDPHAGTARPDPTLAAKLFDAAGWHLHPDGFRYRNGRRLTLELSYRSDSLTDRNLSVVLASMLLGAGIDVSLKGYETSLYFGPVGTGILADGRYEAGLMLWYAGVDPDNSSQLVCSERPPAGYNWARYCNAAMDAAQRSALTRYDRATRIRAYARIERLLAADAPFVYLWWPRQIEAISDDLHGFEPNGVIEDWNAYRWSLESTERDSAP